MNAIGLHTSLPALEGRIFTSLGFQPQVGWRGGHWWSVSAVRAPSRLGLKPQATQYPPFQGGPPAPPLSDALKSLGFRFEPTHAPSSHRSPSPARRPRRRLL